MDMKEAVKTAKRYSKDVFSEEAVGDPTLEEIWFDERKSEWCITVGVRRRSPSSILEPLLREAQVDYKTVRISDKDGKIVSVKIRDIKAA